MKPVATTAARSAATSGRLAPAEASLIALCDGSLDLDALGAASGLDRAALLDRLEGLADAGLLTQRAAPPTGVSRRGLLGGLLGASAVAATASLPRLAQAAPADLPAGAMTLKILICLWKSPPTCSPVRIPPTCCAWKPS